MIKPRSFNGLKPFILYKTVILLTLVGTFTVSGCSQYSNDNAVTIASQQSSPMIFDDQASRNNGAWGAVYMSKEALTRSPTNIVDVNSIPKISEDAGLQKWLTKFEGSSQGKSGFFLLMVKSFMRILVQVAICKKARAHEEQATIHR